MFRLTKQQQRGAFTFCCIVALIIFVRAQIRFNVDKEMQKRLSESYETRVEEDSIAIVPFDPNTVQMAELMKFGLSKYEALSIIRYRSAGKVFHIKEELIGCYGISDSLYFALEPYIVIGEEYRYKPKSYPQKNYPPKSYQSTKEPQRETTTSYRSYRSEPKIEMCEFLADTVGVKFLVGIGALTTRQAEVFVKWRDMSGIHSMEELRECYVVSDECATKLENYIRFTPRPERVQRTSKELIDLNKADIKELISIYGVGEKSALAILEYREKLGGFYSKEQLSEIKMITESNFEKIIQQIVVDSCDISKIDINFAPAKDLANHPYIGSKPLRKLLKTRQLKGGWSNLEQIIEDNIFDEQEAARLRPYLQFSEPSEF